MLSLFDLCHGNGLMILTRNNPPDEVHTTDKKFFLHVRTSRGWKEESMATIYKAYGDDLEDLVEEATEEVKLFLLGEK